MQGQGYKQGTHSSVGGKREVMGSNPTLVEGLKCKFELRLQKPRHVCRREPPELCPHCKLHLGKTAEQLQPF